MEIDMPERTPTKLKLINGERSSRINTDEPAAREMTRLPTAPAWMTVSQIALFKTICRELMAMRMLYSADLDCLVQYVVAADLCTTLAAKINQLDTAVIFSDTGMPHAHPYFGMLDRAQTRLSLLAKQYGLTPLARASLRLAATVPNTEAGAETPASYFAGA